MALLRKLAGDESERDDDEIASIIENINNILNTKRGYGFFLQDFGLSDYHHLSSCNDITAIIINEVTENIARFEPRIKLINIEAINENTFFRQSFCIDCVVRDNARPLKLFLDPILGCYEDNV